MASDTAMASTTLATTFSELQTQDAQFLQILVIQVPWLKRRLKPPPQPDELNAFEAAAQAFWGTFTT